MYTVLKSFATDTISASKGKVIEIKDKKIAKAFLEAGLIAQISEKEMSNKEMETKLKEQEKQLADKDLEIQTLNEKIEELEQEISKLQSNENDKSINDNLDNNDSKTLQEDESLKNNSDESTPSETINE